jgi:hydroxymethylglutaryl-CoA lyase
MVVMMDEMGIDTQLDVDKVLETGTMVERIVGRRLRSESIRNGRIPKTLTGRG